MGGGLSSASGSQYGYQPQPLLGTPAEPRTPFAGRDQFGRYPSAAPQSTDLSSVYNQMFSGGTALKQGRDPRWLFPLKKPGVAMSDQTDWYGYSMYSPNASTQFPPAQTFFGQGNKVL